jgi:hypothetical protein
VFIYCGAVSGTDIIACEEIIKMLTLVHGKSVFSQHEAMFDVLKDLQTDKNGKTINELSKWMHENPMITNPIRMVYSNLREKLIGVKFWDQLSKNRIKNPHLKPINFVIEMAEKEEDEELHKGIENANREEKAGETSRNRIMRPRRGSLLVKARSAKEAPPPKDPSEEEEEEEEDFTAPSAENYQSKRKRKAPDSTAKKVITRPRRQSLTKALSFVRGIGPSKSQKKKEPKRNTNGKGRYGAKRNTSIKIAYEKSSIKVAIDAVKSYTTGTKDRSKKKKNKKRVSAETTVPVSLSDAYDLSPAAEPESGGWKKATRSAEPESGGWKKAERYHQH